MDKEKNGVRKKIGLADDWECPKYTLTDWYKSSKECEKSTELQRQLAQRLICESERLINESNDESLKSRREVNHQIEVKINDIQFVKDTLERQKKQMDEETAALTVYQQRVEDAIKAISADALDICNQCLAYRSQRVGIDLCVDDVEIELAKECEIIQGVKAIMFRTLEQIKEQLRRLRAQTYILNRDLLDKSNVLVIDKHNLTLNEHSLNLSIYRGTAALDPATITENEWRANTQKNIDAATKELNTCIPLRAYVDAILKQVVEDLWAQNDAVTEAFRHRIEEYKIAKIKLERSHFETVRQIDELRSNIVNLEKALTEKENYMALAHTRLGNRCQRENAELCRDEAEGYLVDEVNRIKEACEKLQEMLAEANAALRYLLRNQIQLEEEMNVKINSIKIDEVDCLTIRRAMNYRAY